MTIDTLTQLLQDSKNTEWMKSSSSDETDTFTFCTDPRIVVVVRATQKPLESHPWFKLDNVTDDVRLGSIELLLEGQCILVLECAVLTDGTAIIPRPDIAVAGLVTGSSHKRVVCGWSELARQLTRIANWGARAADKANRLVATDFVDEHDVVEDMEAQGALRRRPRVM